MQAKQIEEAFASAFALSEQKSEEQA